MQEEFRKINDYENYSVSNCGRVRNDVTGKMIKSRIINGYHIIDLRNDSKKKTYYIHRLIASAFIENPDNKSYVDHIDNNKVNNHIDNLRWCTNQENNRNKSIGKNNTSSIKGVYLHKKSNKWYAQITINGKNTHLGSYNTIEEAAEARRRVAEQNFGDFLNACEKVHININIENLTINN